MLRMHRRTPNNDQQVKGKTETVSNGHHSNRRLGCLCFGGLRRRSGPTSATIPGLGFCSWALGFPGTPGRTAILACSWPFGVRALGTPLGAGSSWACLHVVGRAVPGGLWGREIAAGDVLGGRIIIHRVIKVRSLIYEKIIIITVLVAAAEIDDIVMVRIRHNSIGVGILRVLRQFRVASFSVVHQPQYLATISLDLVLIDIRNGSKLRKICPSISIRS